MENIIFNELLCRGYSVDVGVVQVSSTENGVQKKSNLEIDFIVNRGFNVSVNSRLVNKFF